MKLCAFIAALLLFIHAATVEADDGPSWVRIQHIGPQDRPFPTIWITTERLPLPEGTSHQQAVLTQSAYEVVLAVNRDFAKLSAQYDSPIEAGSLQLVEGSNGRERILFSLNRSGSCRYLTHLIDLDSPHDLTELRRVIRDLQRFECG